jgi:hypothetical protein
LGFEGLGEDELVVIGIGAVGSEVGGDDGLLAGSVLAGVAAVVVVETFIKVGFGDGLIWLVSVR